MCNVHQLLFTLRKIEENRKKKIWKMFFLTTSRHFSDLCVKINIHFIFNVQHGHS
eukprot:04548.XXX_147452_147034_1 [CDS] Oithona nana genome sequencing.